MSRTDEIGFYPTLILILGLMIFTALIAVELGRRMGNPNDRHLKEQRANLARARSALEAVNAEQREAAGLKTAVDLYLNGASETHERYRKEIASGFDEVEIAYVQSFLMEMDDPDALHYAVTILDYHQNQRHH